MKKFTVFVAVAGLLFAMSGCVISGREKQFGPSVCILELKLNERLNDRGQTSFSFLSAKFIDASNSHLAVSRYIATEHQYKLEIDSGSRPSVRLGSRGSRDSNPVSSYGFNSGRLVIVENFQRKSTISVTDPKTSPNVIEFQGSIVTLFMPMLPRKQYGGALLVVTGTKSRFQSKLRLPDNLVCSDRQTQPPPLVP